MSLPDEPKFVSVRCDLVRAAAKGADGQGTDLLGFSPTDRLLVAGTVARNSVSEPRHAKTRRQPGHRGEVIIAKRLRDYNTSETEGRATTPIAEAIADVLAVLVPTVEGSKS